MYGAIPRTFIPANNYDQQRPGRPLSIRVDFVDPFAPSTPGRLILDCANITQRLVIPAVANGDAPVPYLVSPGTKPADLATGINQRTARERRIVSISGSTIVS